MDQFDILEKNFLLGLITEEEYDEQLKALMDAENGGDNG